MRSNILRHSNLFTNCINIFPVVFCLVIVHNDCIILRVHAKLLWICAIITWILEHELCARVCYLFLCWQNMWFYCWTLSMFWTNIIWFAHNVHWFTFESHIKNTFVILTLCIGVFETKTVIASDLLIDSYQGNEKNERRKMNVLWLCGLLSADK